MPHFFIKSTHMCLFDDSAASLKLIMQRLKSHWHTDISSVILNYRFKIHQCPKPNE